MRIQLKCKPNLLKEVCSTIFWIIKIIINQLDFDYVIIDEEKQSFEQETLISLSHNVK